MVEKGLSVQEGPGLCPTAFAWPRAEVLCHSPILNCGKSLGSTQCHVNFPHPSQSSGSVLVPQLLTDLCFFHSFPGLRTPVALTSGNLSLFYKAPTKAGDLFFTLHLHAAVICPSAGCVLPVLVTLPGPLTGFCFHLSESAVRLWYQVSESLK